MYEQYFKRIQPEEQKTAETDYEDDFNEILLAANLAADNEEERVEEEDEPLVGQDDPQKPELSVLRQDPQWT